MTSAACCRERRRRSRSREPYKPQQSSGTQKPMIPRVLSSEQRQKQMKDDEEARKKERLQMIEIAKKKNAQLIQSQRVGDAIKRQLEGKATMEDLKILASYGKDEVAHKKQELMAKGKTFAGNVMSVMVLLLNNARSKL